MKQTLKNCGAIRIAIQTTSQRRAGKGKRYKRLSRYHLSGRGTLYSMVLALQELCSSAFHHGSPLSGEKTGETKAVCLEQKRRRKFYLAGRARRRDEFRVSPTSPLFWPKNCGGKALENVAPGNKTNPGVARSVSVLAPPVPRNLFETLKFPGYFVNRAFAHVRPSPQTVFHRIRIVETSRFLRQFSTNRPDETPRNHLALAK